MSYQEKPISETSGIRAERGEALIDHVQRQRRSSMPQFVAAMLVMLFACGLAFGAAATEVVSEAESTNQKDLEDRQVKRSSAFCIFGIDDIKLRPSAGRMKGEERKPLHSENGDCWMDKPGQMA
ncbi:MAG: hypothetical protein AAF542_13495 [Pseudomonadota bacterium]